MGGCMSICSLRNLKIVLFGLDSAGKTTLINFLVPDNSESIPR